MAKKKYKIPVSWEVSGWIEKEADSLQEAVDHAYKAPLPESEYIDGSFKVDCDDGQILENDYPGEAFDLHGGR